MDALWVMHQRDIQIGHAAVGHSDVAQKEAIVPVVGGSRVMAQRRRPTFMISEAGAYPLISDCMWCTTWGLGGIHPARIELATFSV